MYDSDHTYNKYSHLDRLKKLIAQRADMNVPGVDGDASLHYASTYGKLKILFTL